MKIFVSSIITGYEDRRAAVFEAVETLSHEIIRAEDFGVSTSSPRVACLQGVRDADLVVLIVGERYGYPQQSGLSATHEEFREAKESKEIIALIEEDVQRDSAQAAFLKEVQDWQGGVFTENFRSPDDLRRKVTRFLHKREIDAARGSVDNEALESRVQTILSDEERNWSGGDPKLVVAFVGGPPANLLRPAELQSEELDQFLSGASILGKHAILSRAAGIQTRVVSNFIEAYQENGSIRLFADGALRIRTPLPRNSNLGAIIEEDVNELLNKSLRMANLVFSHVDETERLRAFALAAKIEDSGYSAWRSREEERRSPNSMTMNRAWGEKKDAPVFWHHQQFPEQNCVLRHQISLKT
ncbi:DUF4062 domain-containing protein [Oricola indica]|jgi:hypothetical protein|uniref:DUF4062 domain-containing protein n=1 Tax=Oricola indica TaxID=2872591 RepID=UPI001CBBC465|nr:DUF4062 domain-containing protein [Oricola indica]